MRPYSGELQLRVVSRQGVGGYGRSQKSCELFFEPVGSCLGNVVRHSKEGVNREENSMVRRSDQAQSALPPDPAASPCLCFVGVDDFAWIRSFCLTVAEWEKAVVRVTHPHSKGRCYSLPVMSPDRNEETKGGSIGEVYRRIDAGWWVAL